MRTIRAERRLAAIMAADIVGYSRLIQADEAATLAAVKRLRSEVIEPLLAGIHRPHREAHGRWRPGRVRLGRRCSRLCGRPAEEHCCSTSGCSCRRIVFRIGINLGDVVVEGEDLLGDGVNVAARLEQLCPPGGVLISGTACDHMKGKLDLPLDLGEQQVKKMAQPVRTCRPTLPTTRATRRPFSR